MTGSVDKSGRAAHNASVYRASQSGSAQQAQKKASQPEAKSSYTFQDSRHVVRGGGMAAVSLELTIEEATAENVDLLGFEQGDHLRLDGMGPVQGSALIKVLTADCLELQIKLTVPQMSRRAASMAFERLTKQTYLLDADGQVNLTASIAKDGKGGYAYTLVDDNNKHKPLMSDTIDLRIDNFSAGNIMHQVQTFMVESGNNITFAIEKAPDQDPKGTLKVSLAPGIGDFDVTRQEHS